MTKPAEIWYTWWKKQGDGVDHEPAFCWEPINDEWSKEVWDNALMGWDTALSSFVWSGAFTWLGKTIAYNDAHKFVEDLRELNLIPK